MKDNNMKDDMKDNTEDKIKKYGTFFDSKEEIIQLYILFIFFGIHRDIIKQFPTVNEYEYEID